LSERARLARELNDTLLQTIEASKLIADDALDSPTDPVRIRAAMGRLSYWLGQATQEGQAALNLLGATSYDGNDLASGFRRAAEECLLHRSVDFVLSVAGDIRKLFPEHLPEFIFSVNTGMRLTEQYKCTWSQVDMSRRAIDLTMTKNGSARTVRLQADSMAALESVKLPGQKPTDSVFPRQGTSFDTRSWFQPCLAEAKITGYVWHSNRHTFCSWLAMAGATLKEIQELAGHKTITMSARYSHLSPDHKLSVLDRITAEAAKTATRPEKKTATRPQARTATKKPTGTGNPNSHENSHQQETAILQKRPQ
jgi:hypothetical protein